MLQNKKRSRTDENNRSIRASTESLTSKLNSSINSTDDELIGDTCATEEEWQAPKRMALHEANIPRYVKEFVELSLIGRFCAIQATHRIFRLIILCAIFTVCFLGEGEFGAAYKCLNRLDGCIYAIKKSIKPVAGSVFE